MEEHEYDSIEQMKGSMSQQRSPSRQPLSGLII